MLGRIRVGGRPLMRWALGIALLLTGCPGVPVRPEPILVNPPAASASPLAPAPDPAGVPTQVPAVSDGCLAMPSPPYASASPAHSGQVVVIGRVYDEFGLPLSGATVRIKGQDPALAYDSNTLTSDGFYVVNNVPEGKPVVVSATKAGMITRQRTWTSWPNPQCRNIVDFGGLEVAAAPFGLSSRPEILSVTPVVPKATASPIPLEIAVRLSESLDDVARTRFERGLRVLPADAVAADNAHFRQLSGQAMPGPEVQVDGNPAVTPYSIHVGAPFLGKSYGTVRWSRDGLEAIFGFGAPVVTSPNGARYQWVLVATEGLVDPAGNMLGTNAAFQRTMPPAGSVLARTVLRPKPRTDARTVTLTPAEAQWVLDHDDAVTFDVAPDRQAPKLVTMGATSVDDDTLIALVFSEPMAAYDGMPNGKRGAGLDLLANYSLVLGLNGEVPASLFDVPGLPREIDPRTGTKAFGEALSDLGRPFRLAAAAQVWQRAGATPGSVLVEVDADDPRRVNLFILGIRDYFRPKGIIPPRGDVGVRLMGISDPAGNAIVGAQTLSTNLYRPGR